MCLLIHSNGFDDSSHWEPLSELISGCGHGREIVVRRVTNEFEGEKKNERRRREREEERKEGYDPASKSRGESNDNKASLVDIRVGVDADVGAVLDDAADGLVVQDRPRRQPRLGQLLAHLLRPSHDSVLLGSSVDV